MHVNGGDVIGREAEIRERLRQRGYDLRRAPMWGRTRSPYGGYMIVNSAENVIVAGYEPFAFSLDLEGVSNWLQALAANAERR
jgi:hypothetical protein